MNGRSEMPGVEPLPARVDVWLEPLQRLVVIAAIVIGGVTYLQQEEGASRLNASISWQPHAGCSAAVDLDLENAGESVLEIRRVILTLRDPVAEEGVPPLAIEIDEVVRTLRSQEHGRVSLDLVEMALPSVPFLRLHAILQVAEEGARDVRYVSEAVSVPPSCGVRT